MAKSIHPHAQNLLGGSSCRGGQKSVSVTKCRTPSSDKNRKWALCEGKAHPARRPSTIQEKLGGLLPGMTNYKQTPKMNKFSNWNDEISHSVVSPQEKWR